MVKLTAVTSSGYVNDATEADSAQLIGVAFAIFIALALAALVSADARAYAKALQMLKRNTSSRCVRNERKPILFQRPSYYRDRMRRISAQDIKK